MLDVEAALQFVAKSRSRLVRIAADWIVTLEDPVDVLFVLSRDTADAMGPYETFRYASLLGLVSAHAVRELGLDVLAEPVADSATPPVPHAFALAHARHAFPDEAVPFAHDVLTALDKRPAQGFHDGLLAAARLAAAAAGAGDIDARALAAHAALESEDGVRVAASVLEALHLSGLETDRALAKVQAGQQDDGGLTALLDNDVIRGLTTLRVLCLLRPPTPAR